MKKILFIIALGVVFIFNGCSSVSNEQKNIYSDNILIQKDGDSFSFFNRTGDQNDSKLDITYSKFYGAETIWKINVEKQGDLKFDINSVVDNGKFKGVLISEEGEITTIFEGEKEGVHNVVLSEGKYKFKIVGNDSTGKVRVELKLDKNMNSIVIK